MGVDERRVDGLLGLVGLDRSAARKRVRQYCAELGGSVDEIVRRVREEAVSAQKRR